MRAARAASSISSSVAAGLAKRRFSRMEAWKRYVSCETTPIVRASDESVALRMSMPSIVTAAALDVVEARDEVADGRLPRAGLADDGGRRSCRHLEADVLERPAVLFSSGTRRARRRGRRDRAGRSTASSRSMISTGWSRYSKTRSKRASEVCASICTLRREPIGQKSRVCSVVKATTVPSETAPTKLWPANQ
jgi:hypothetical protein